MLRLYWTEGVNNRRSQKRRKEQGFPPKTLLGSSRCYGMLITGMVYIYIYTVTIYGNVQINDFVLQVGGCLLSFFPQPLE